MSNVEIKYLVYVNCINLIKFRGFTPIKELTKDEFFKSNDEYIYVTSPEVVMIMFTDLVTSIVTAKIKTLIARSTSSQTVQEVILVTDTPKYTKLQSAVKLINSAKLFKPLISVMNNTALRFNMPTHINFIKYEKISQDELTIFENTEHHNREQFPKVEFDDVNIRWYGFKSRDFVKAYQPSVNCGISITYKMVL